MGATPQSWRKLGPQTGSGKLGKRVFQEEGAMESMGVSVFPELDTEVRRPTHLGMPSHVAAAGPRQRNKRRGSAPWHGGSSHRL